MISPQDDLFGHQLPTTFDHVGSSDPAWVERYWYSGHRVPAGDIVLDVGMGYYPNRNVMDCFAGISWKGTQHNFRASRRLRGDPLATRVGPLRVEVLAGLKQHRLVLEANESGLTFDVVFDATMHPHEEDPHFRRRDGRVMEDMVRTGQFGRYSGWLQLNGKRVEMTPDTWFAQRDHSWGIRAQMRSDESSPPLTVYPPFFYVWCQVQFDDTALHLYAQEKSPGRMFYLSGEIVGPVGSADRKRPRVVDFAQDVRWKPDPLGQTLDIATFRLTMNDGTTKLLELKGLPARYFLKGGLYGGLNGWAHGDDRGALYKEHDVWDLGNAEVRRVAKTLADHVIEARMDDEVGYGIIEYGVGKGYPMYAEIQAFPAI
jgi:hypothetical protein